MCFGVQEKKKLEKIAVSVFRTVSVFLGLVCPVITQSNCSYAKYLVYLTFALDRQKVLSIIVLIIIRRCVSQCYSLYLLFFH